MSRGPYRSSTGDLGRTAERWDRDRFNAERDRDRFDDVLERGPERGRFEEEDDHVYTRGGPPQRGPPPRPRVFDDDLVFRGRRTPYDNERRLPTRRRSPSGSSVDRRVFIERQSSRERAFVHSPSPPRRPTAMLLRRQSSLDTFDRKPRGYYDRDQYGPPARRDDFRPPVNLPIPLPRSKALPPPRRYAQSEYFDDIRVSGPEYFGDEDYRSYREGVREEKIIRTRRRNRSRNRSRDSRSSHAYSHRGSSARSSSRSSSTSTSSSSSSGGTTVKSDYPKKGKTRIPARLVSRRALVDLGYPFIEEGNTIIVQRALGQENIDDLLHLSEQYRKDEREHAAARSHAGDIIEERRQEIIMVPAPVPAAVPVAPAAQAPAPQAWTTPPATSGPVIVNATQPAPAPGPVEIVDTTTVMRAVSPARSYTTSTTSHASSYAPVIIDGGREISEEMAVGPLALVEPPHRHRSRRRRAHSHGHEVVVAQRQPNGTLVLIEEVKKPREPRLEMRNGKMSISVPKYRS